MKYVIALFLVLVSGVSLAEDGYKACMCTRTDGMGMVGKKKHCDKSVVAMKHKGACLDVTKANFQRYSDDPEFGECTLSEKVFCMSPYRTN